MKQLALFFFLATTAALAQVAAPPAAISNWPTANTVLALADPNVNKLLMWDDALNKYAFVTLGTNLAWSGTTLNATAGGGGVTSVGLSMPSVFAVGSTPITSSGTLAVTYTDPNIHALLGWDNTDNALTNIAIGSGLTYTQATHTLSAPGGTVTNSFPTIAVSGQSNVVATSATDTLTLAAGTGITLTTSAGTDTVTIAGNTGTVTHTAGNLTSSNVVTGAGTADIKVISGLTVGTTGAITNNLGTTALTGLTMKRFQDTSDPTANFLNFTDTSGSSLFAVNISGTMTTGTVPEARMAWTNPAANTIRMWDNTTQVAPINATIGTGLGYVSNTPAGAGTLSVTANSRLRTITATVDGGGSAITTGKVKGFFTCPYSGTITGWNVTVDTGTATIDVWKIATGTAKPTSSNLITAAGGLPLTTGTSIHSTNVTTTYFASGGTTVTANDIFAFNVQAATSATEVSCTLEITTN